jgi:hypothetical protein
MKSEEKELNQRDELVTVAIHTYEKAQILKSILEANSIPAVITSVNIIQPNPAGSYRVKIRNSGFSNRNISITIHCFLRDCSQPCSA